MAVGGGKSYTRALRARRRGRVLASAVGCVVEQLEDRRLMTAAPTLVHLGTAAQRVATGAPFKLRLDATGNPNAEQALAWDIDWGDGAVDHVQTSPGFVAPLDYCCNPIPYMQGSPEFAQHVYGTAGDYSVSATLYYRDGAGGQQTQQVTGLSFDATFGGGMVGGRFGDDPADTANAVAPLPNGRLLVAGNVGGRMAIMAAMPNGAADASFGVDGLATLSFGGDYVARGSAVVVAGGKYLVAGDVYSTADGYAFALARFNGDGTPDDSFGDHGKVITPFPDDARANAVAVQTDGSIIVAGFNAGNFAVARYRTDGSLDTSWGGGSGKVVLNFGSPQEVAYGIGIAPDGKVVVTGRNAQDVVVVRLLASGALDTSFGTAGKTVIDLGTGDFTYSVAFTPTGKIVLGGETNGHFAVVQLNANGTPDTAFSGDGIAELATLGTAYARTVLAQADGKIIAGGGDAGYYDIVRLNTNGTLDSTFAQGGVDQTFDATPDGGYFSALGAYDADGRILAMGGVGTKFVVARYLPQNKVTVLPTIGLANGSFETPNVGWGTTRTSGSTIGEWHVENGAVDQAGTRWQAAVGAQSLSMTSGDNTGVIYQDVQTIPGQSYTLRFAVAGDPGLSTVYGLGVTWTAVGVAQPESVGTVTFDSTGHTAQSMGWQYHEFTVVATGPVMRLRFVQTPGVYGAALDDVTLTPVNAVKNGSFENNSGGCSPPDYWTVDGDPANDLSASWEGPAADGGAHADLARGAIAQTLTVVAGQKYRLEFSVASDSGAAGVDVYWDGQLVGTVGGAGQGVGRWREYSFAVTAASASGALRFQSAGGQVDLDNVRLVPIAKPAAPANVRARAVSPTRVDVNWQDASADETQFVIRASSDGVNYSVVGRAGAGASHYAVTGLDPNTAYTFKVTAWNDGARPDRGNAWAEGVGVESDPGNVAQALTPVAVIAADHLVSVGAWRINADGTAVVGQSGLPTLEDGVDYRLTVTNLAPSGPEGPLAVRAWDNSGACCCPSAYVIYGDAEYAWNYDNGELPDGTWQTDASDLHNGTNVGLRITAGLRSAIASWGPYNSAHAYVRDVVGNGQALAAAYADDVLSDNVGAVLLTIKRIVPAETPAPSVSIGGAGTVVEGQPYTLTLDAGPDGVDSWAVDWGDGNEETISGVGQPRVQTVSHTYADGAPNPTITAEATNTGGSGEAAPLVVRIVPLAPTGLTATSHSHSVIELAWTNGSHVATATSIERSGDGGASWEEVASVGPDTEAYADADLDEGTAYAYRVRATTGTDNSGYSGTSSATTRPAPATNLVAVATSSTSIHLSWDDNSTTNTGYVIAGVPGHTTGPNYCCSGSGGVGGDGYCCSPEVIVDGDGYEVTGLSPDTTYYFEIYARGAAGDAVEAAKAQETTNPAGPLPAVVTGIAATVSGGQVSLSWNAASGATGLRLERLDLSVGTWATLAQPAASATTYTDATAQANHTYAYRVVALNTYGAAAPSDAVSATTGLVAPTGLTAAPDANGNVELTWTDNSANEGGFKIWRTATVGGVPQTTLVGEAPAGEGTGTVTFLVSDLEVGTSYTFAVAAATDDATSAQASSSAVTPSLQSVSVSGDPEMTFLSPYELTLHRDGIGVALTWTVDWGDGSEPQTVTGTPDSGGDLYVSHTFSGPADGNDFAYTIRATADTATDTFIADDFAVNGHAGSGLMAPPSISTLQGRKARRAIVAAFQDVYNNIKYELYYGALKGSDATASTGRGNDWDQAALLKKRIEAIVGTTNFQGTAVVKYVRGLVSESVATLEAWYGLKDAKAVGRYLNLADEDVDDLTNETMLVVEHVWLEVNLPEYGWGDPQTHKGIEIDPSRKFRDLRAGISDVGVVAETKFNAADFRSQSVESPWEFYESEVAQWMKGHTSGGQNDLVGRLSVADLAYDGPILAKQFTDLPAVTSRPGYAAYTLSTGSDAVALGLDHRVEVQLDTATGTGINGAGMVPGTKQVITLSMPEVGNRAVTIRYSTEAGTGYLIAKLFVGETPAAQNGGVLGKFYQSGGQFGTALVAITVKALQPNVTSAQVTDTSGLYLRRDRTLGDPIALMLDAGQFGAADLHAQQKALNDLANQDTSANHISLGQYQAQLVGLIASKYAHDFDAGRQAVAGLAGTVDFLPGVGLGFITGVGTAGRVKVEGVANPFKFFDSARGQGIYVDLPRLQWDEAPIEGNDASRYSARDDNADEAIGYTYSYLESAVLESLTNVEAVSTVKGFQLAKSSAFLHFYPGHTTDQGVSISNLFGSLSSTGDIDLRNSVIGRVTAGYTVDVPNTLIDIGGWHGAVWKEFKSDEQGVASAFVISQNGLTVFGGYPTSNDFSIGAIPQEAAPAIERQSVSDQINIGQSTVTYGDPVNLFTGGLYDDETDISLPNVAFPAAFSRHYDSTSTVDRGFGKGWMFSYGDYIKENLGDHSVTWTTAQGQTYVFTNDGNSSYRNPSGLFGTFAPMGKDGFSYTELDGTKYVFARGANGRLLRIVDRLGNQLSFKYYDGSKASYSLASVDFKPAQDLAGAKARTLFTISNFSDGGRQRTVTDYAGRTWTYRFENRSDGRYLTSVNAYVSTKKGQSVEQLTTSYAYYTDGARAGLLSTITRKVGGTVRGTQTYDYYANRRVFSTTDATGRTEYFSYNQFTSPTFNPANANKPYTHTAYHTDLSGHTTEVEFNQAGLVTRTINPDRSRVDQAWSPYDTRREEDPAHWKYQLKATTNEVGLTDLYKYDTRGNVAYHLGDSWNYSPAQGGKGNGIATRSEYEQKGFNGLTLSEVSGVLPAAGGTTSPRIVDQRTTTYAYDHGNLVRTRNAVGDVTEMGYDGNGLLLWSRAPKGVGGDATTQDLYKTRYSYDANGSGQVHVTSHYLPTSGGNVLTAVQTTDYDARGNATLVTDATGRKVRTDYDALDRKRQTVVDPDGLALTTQYVYWDDLLKAMYDPTLRQTKYEYDAMGRPTSVTYVPTGAVTQTVYDAAGNATQTVDPLGRRTDFVYDERNRRTQTLYADGGFSRVLLDGAGRPVVTSEPSGTVTAYGQDATARTQDFYDREGFLSAVIDPANQKTTFEYNGVGEQVAVRYYTSATTSSSLYRTTLLVRDELGRVRQTRGDGNLVTSVEFDRNGNPTESTQYEVNGLDYMNLGAVKLKNLPTKRRHATTTEYDIADRAISVTDPAGHVTRTEYDAANRVIAVTDPRGTNTPSSHDYKTISEYDGAGRLETTILPWVDEDTAHTDAIEYGYYGDGRVHTVTDPRDLTTTYTYADSTTGTSTRTYLQGDTQHYTLEHRDLAGELDYVQDRKGNVTTYEYDARGRVIQTNLPAGESGVQPYTTNTYDQAGNLTITSNPTTGLTVTRTYDALHRVVSTKTEGTGIPTPITTATTYAHNNVDTVTDGRGYVTAYRYDKADHVTGVYVARTPGTAVNFSTDQISKNEYDSFGNLIAETVYPDRGNPAVGRTTTHSHYKDNRLMSTTEPDPDGRGGVAPLTTTYQYDEAGNLAHVIDPEGDTVTLYDARNRLKTQTRPDPDGAGVGQVAKPTVYVYDADGNVAHMTDPGLNQTDYEYDDLNRLTSEATTAYLDASHTAVPVTRTYDLYDLNGNLVDMTDRDGRKHHFSYDGQDNLIEERWGPLSTDPKIHFKYDTAGRLIWADSSYQGSGDTTRDYKNKYDALGRVTQYKERVTNDSEAAAITLDNTYDGNGNRSKQIATIGSTVDHTDFLTFDELNQVNNVRQTVPGLREKEVIIGVDRAGEVTSMDRRIGGGAVPGAYRTYRYDAAGYLTSIVAAGGIAEHTIGRDQKHRVTSLKRDNQAAQAFTYYYDDQLKTAPGQTLTFDPNFNRTGGGRGTGADNRLTTDGTYNYEYDAEGNLTSRINIADNSHVDFAYDFRNRLTTASIYNTSGTLTKSVGYEYDAMDRRTRQVSSSGDQRFAYDGDDAVIVFNGAVTAANRASRYLYGPGDHQVLAEDANTNTSTGTPTRWYLADHEGSIRKVVDDQGGLVKSLDYDAFGNVTASTGSGAAPRHQYTAQMFDADTGLSYYGARFYDPKIGRFVNQDPSEDGTNLYAYVANNPLGNTDPTGLSAKLVGMGQENSYVNIALGGSANSSPYSQLSNVTSEILGREATWEYANPTTLPELVSNYAAYAPLSTGTGITASQISNPWAAELWDLESRKNYDYSQHSGKPGPDSAYLWQKIQDVKADMKSQGTGFWYWSGWDAIDAFRTGYVETAENGQQFDSVTGYVDSLTRGTYLNRDGLEPTYGHWDDFRNGQTVGNYAQNVAGLAITVYGIGGIIKGAAGLVGALSGGGRLVTTTGSIARFLNLSPSVAAVGTGSVGGLETWVGIKMMASKGIRSSSSNVSRPAPAADNYRGRYQADLYGRNRPRLPEDWDVHHRIPQEYMNHPALRDFDFHHPSNLQGVRGSRSTPNIHQLITNDWAEFGRTSPSASRSEIEAFARQMDGKYAEHWWK